MEPKQIILLEDELIIARHIQLLLEKNGYQVLRSDTVEKCITLVKENKPSLVLLDINLKHGFEGIEVGNFLLKYDQVPYVYLTSYADSRTLEKVKRTRPMGYIVKPFKGDDILTTVAIAINNYNFKGIDVSRRKETDNFSEAPFKIKKAIRFIQENIELPITVEGLANLTGWDRTHFTRNFKKYMNVSPYQYVLRTKIETAKELLRNDKDVAITDISCKLGFSSHSNFTNAFLKFNDVTAEDYRKMVRIGRAIN